MQDSKITAETAFKTADSAESVDLIVDDSTTGSITLAVPVPATAPSVPSPALVNFRSSSLTLAHSALSNSEAQGRTQRDQGDELKKPLCTPGIVLSLLWAAVLLMLFVLDLFNRNGNRQYWNDALSYIIALSGAISVYWAFCMYRVTKGMTLIKKLPGLSRSFSVLASLCYQPLFLCMLSFWVALVVWGCGYRYAHINNNVAYGWATLFFFLFPASLSTSWFYWFTMRLQERFLDASVSLARRRATALWSAWCHVLPGSLLLLNFFWQACREHAHAGQHLRVTLIDEAVVFVFASAFALCQYTSFKLLKSWLYSEKSIPHDHDSAPNNEL